MDDVIDFHIAPRLDNKTLMSCYMACSDWRESYKPEINRRRLERRRDVIRCASIYKYLPVPEEQFPNNIVTSFPGCSTLDTEIIRRVIGNCWFRMGPLEKYRKYDPELFDYLHDDMRMGAPHDAPLIYNFYMKVIKEVGSL